MYLDRGINEIPKGENGGTACPAARNPTPKHPRSSLISKTTNPNKPVQSPEGAVNPIISLHTQGNWIANCDGNNAPRYLRFPFRITLLCAYPRAENVNSGWRMINAGGDPLQLEFQAGEVGDQRSRCGRVDEIRVSAVFDGEIINFDAGWRKWFTPAEIPNGPGEKRLPPRSAAPIFSPPGRANEIGFVSWQPRRVGVVINYGSNDGFV